MSLVLALSSVLTAGLAEAAGDFWSPDGIEYVEVCQDFGHYAARKPLPSSILLLKSAITSAGCLYPIDECGRRRSWNPSIHSMQANSASSRAADALLRHISFLRLAQRLSATASSRRQPVLPTERRASSSRAHPARREPVHRLPRSERKTAPPATQPRPSAVPRAGTQTSTAVEGEKARPTAVPVARPIAPAGHGRPPPALRRAEVYRFFGHPMER